MSVTACLIILLLDDSIFIALTISSADAIESAFCDAWCMITSAASINGTVSSVTTEGAGDGGLDILYTHVFIRIAAAAAAAAAEVDARFIARSTNTSQLHIIRME